MKTFALIRNSRIDNIAIVDDASESGQAYLGAIIGEYDAVIEMAGATIGQYIDDNGELIPLPTLTAEPATIPPDGNTFSTVTYANTEPDAPDEIAFVINDDAPIPIHMINGVAVIGVISQTPDDIINISAGGLTAQVQVGT